MSTPHVDHHRSILERIACTAMAERGLLAEFSAQVMADVNAISGPATGGGESVRDLRALPWCSIDNDDSRDLDQLTAAEAKPDGACTVFVAVADVDALVPRGSAVDKHARENTTSVYTVAETFPMIPPKLSTNLTSLNEGEDRRAIVIEMTFDAAGALLNAEISMAMVNNKAKLAYDSVGGWLEGHAPVPDAVRRVEGLDANLRLQDRAASMLKAVRHQHGALDFDIVETRAVFDGDHLKDLQPDVRNRAKDLIEDFMIAVNGVTARYLAFKKLPSLRRVVRTPKRWDRIIEIAAERGSTLTREPDAKALELFLIAAKLADPVRFPDLSLSIIKLLGPGEYAVQLPGELSAGHFGLAVKDYTHSTAPNRRYPDLITQRLIKSALASERQPYANEELTELASHCTQAEDAAKKVERSVVKSAAAILLESRIGEQFDGVVTGASPKGTWVRLFTPPVEGWLEIGFEGAEVGHRMRVELLRTDVEKGFIDFKKVK